ncbi:uncharacterized protein STEHIDRAFT_118279 [Stereum hirsutum FP-91666 SS1]|uniref:uncharacterized protein n=1 Tax=Stereum hirsutum (strain FP-91666) TaxID=721885 RepID=UPI000440D105|nr:uncharacterized protein STEHIDRAFT_118279 [Stereum hirsutum FP-91666 SS1]EIM91139.1 hypothetical protein STEHIDRAFT_118279 [Stereum hirsutum FP-91666 SS1]
MPLLDSVPTWTVLIALRLCLVFGKTQSTAYRSRIIHGYCLTSGLCNEKGHDGLHYDERNSFVVGRLIGSIQMGSVKRWNGVWLLGWMADA